MHKVVHNTATAQRLVATGPRRADLAGRPVRLAGPAPQPCRGYDIVLSSGFLAFANHSGFLAAVEEVGLPVNAVMGTSAGALSGSLWAAGYSAETVAEILSSTAPIKRVRLCARPWAGGLLTMEVVREELCSWLPPRFEDLQRPLGVGLASSLGHHVLVDNGVLPEPVAASAAIPCIFAPVDVPGVPGGPFKDGGVHCRIGLNLWRQSKYGASPAAAPAAVVHLIERSSPFSGNDDTSDFARQNALVLKSKKSGKSFWDLGDFDADFEAARRRAVPQLREFMERQHEKQEAARAAGEQRGSGRSAGGQPYGQRRRAVAM